MKLLRRYYRRTHPLAVLVLVPVRSRQILIPSSTFFPQSGVNQPLFSSSNRLFLSTRHGLESLNISAVPTDLDSSMIATISRAAVLPSHAFRPLLQLMKNVRRRQCLRPWRKWDASVVRELEAWPQAQGNGDGDDNDNGEFEVWRVRLHLEKHHLCGPHNGNKTFITEEGKLNFRWTVRNLPFTSVYGPITDRYTEDVFFGDWESGFVQGGGAPVVRDPEDDFFSIVEAERRASEDSGCCPGD